MIYLPTDFNTLEYVEDMIDPLRQFVVDNKHELSYNDRIDAILLILDHLGYKWEEYQEERKQTQYYLDTKRESIRNAKEIRSQSGGS
jgi:hypothetical protein